ncbi:MAG: hypothetical protein LC745_01460 [Planctomycetia bacterium]|nr:hypothetical protein [Planctomycetia bacterium]
MGKPLAILCETLAREPGEIDRAALAAHLASCPRCASLAGRESAFTRVWDATRPSEPTAAAWDALWARVSDRLDRAPEPRTLTSSARPRGREHVWTAFVVAQAAAVLAAVVLWGAHRASVEKAGTSVVARPPLRVIDIEVGAVVMIHLEGGDVRAVEMARDERWDTIDENFVLLNGAEAMFGTHETIAEMHHDAHAAPPPG